MNQGQSVLLSNSLKVFLGLVISFSETQHGGRGPCDVVCEIAGVFEKNTGYELTRRDWGSEVLIQVLYFEVKSWWFSQVNQVGNDSGGRTINYTNLSPLVLSE